MSHLFLAITTIYLASLLYLNQIHPKILEGLIGFNTAYLIAVFMEDGIIKWRKKRIAAEGGMTICLCPKCRLNLVEYAVEYTDTDLVRYTCRCGHKSGWQFDAPVPLLMEGDLN